MVTHTGSRSQNFSASNLLKEIRGKDAKGSTLADATESRLKRIRLALIDLICSEQPWQGCGSKMARVATREKAPITLVTIFYNIS